MEDKIDKDKNDKKKGHNKNKISGHKKLKSSGQLLTTHHNFKLALSELPESFFEKIISTEIDLSDEFTMDNLNKLIQLYSEAIEFYTQNDPSQVKYYQGRIEILLSNTDTLKKLKKQSQNLVKNKENKNTVEPDSEKNNKSVDSNNKNKSQNLNKSELKKKIEMQTENLLFDDISKQVNKVLGENNINDPQNKKGIDIITQDLNQQNEKWKEKLKNKKKNILKNSANAKLKHQRGISLDVMKSFSSEVIRNENIKDGKDKDEISMDKFDKIKNMFNLDSIEEVKEVKEENEGEGNDMFKNSDKKQNNNIHEIKDISEDKENNKIKDNKEKKIEKSDDKKNLKKEEPEEEIDEKILTSVNEKMDLLMKLIDDIENNKLSKEDEEDNTNENNENNIKLEEDSSNIISELNTDLINIPFRFQSTYIQVQNLISEYITQFNNFFFKDIFEQFALNLKEIYDNKYKKYIDVRLEYHSQIKENEHLLENHPEYSEEKKAEIQQIIDSLKDEQQNQIAKIEDEFNRLIVSKVDEFKIKSFKNNSGILLIEEKLKLEIYALINESFYGN